MTETELKEQKSRSLHRGCSLSSLRDKLLAKAVNCSTTIPHLSAGSQFQAASDAMIRREVWLMAAEMAYQAMQAENRLR